LIREKEKLSSKAAENLKKQKTAMEKEYQAKIAAL
jgi:hypothetical protein